MKDYYLCSKMDYPKDKYVLYYEKEDDYFVIYFADGHLEVFNQYSIELEQKYLECMEKQIYDIWYGKKFFWNLNGFIYPVVIYYILKGGRFINWVNDLFCNGFSFELVEEYLLFSIPVFISRCYFMYKYNKFKIALDDFEKNRLFLKIQNRLHNYRLFEPQLFNQAIESISGPLKKLLLDVDNLNINSIRDISREDIIKLSKSLK